MSLGDRSCDTIQVYERFDIEGLDVLEAALRRHDSNIGYLLAVDRTDWNKDEPLGRFDWTEEAAALYAEDTFGPDAEDDERPTGDDDEDLEEEDEDLDEEEEDDESAEEEPGGDSSAPVGPDLVAAALRWVRELCERNTIGMAWSRVRVRLNGPKGHRLVDSAQLMCRNVGWSEEQDEMALREMRIPEPADLEREERASHSRSVKVLGDLYAQWGRIVIGSVGQMQTINNATHARTARQLADSQRHLDTVLGKLLRDRLDATKLVEKRRSDDQTNQLVEQALHQIGDVGKAYLISQGLTPEMTEVMGALGNSSELMGALGDPEVKALLNDPDNLRDLAKLLKDIAAKTREAKGAAAGNG